MAKKKVLDHVEKLQEIGKAVKTARYSTGKSMKDLAKEAGISFVWLNNLENGLLQNASIEKLYQVCKPLNLTINIDVS